MASSPLKQMICATPIKRYLESDSFSLNSPPWPICHFIPPFPSESNQPGPICLYKQEAEVGGMSVGHVGSAFYTSLRLVSWDLSIEPDLEESYIKQFDSKPKQPLKH